MLFDDWKSSTIILNNGSEFNNTMVKYNVLRNKFLFHRNDSTFEFLDDVAEIRMKDDNLNDIVFKKITNAEIKAQEGSYVQVLSEGKVMLYKHYTRTIEGENYTNGIFTSEKKIIPHNSIWAIVNNKTLSVKTNASFLEELTSDKIDDVKKYIKEKRLNIKSEKDFAAAISFYNLINSSPKN